MTQFQCPKCSALLDQEGELVFNGQTMAVYQCIAESCLVYIGQRRIPAGFTFAVTADGKILDPASLDPIQL